MDAPDLLQTIWTDVIWAGGLAATPVALVAAFLCSTKRVRPATRHALALAALVSFMTPAIAGAIWRPDLLPDLLKVADSVMVPGSIGPPTSIAPAVTQPSAPAPALRHDAPRPSTAPVLGAATGADSPEHAPLSRVTSAGTTSAVVPNAAFPILSSYDWRSPAAALATPASLRFAAESTSATSERPRPVLAAARPAVTPAPESPAPAKPEPRSSTVSTSSWLARIVALRDAVAAIPPLPSFIWLTGFVAFLVLHLISAVSARRVLRDARPAPHDLVASVADASRSLGLSATPTVLITDARVSPMVSCGLSPRLVIPSELWSSLDDDSRRAVLVHELAHVRRGDHRWCWLESLVLAAYWWHPLVWWLRRRLRDDAEICCDAWVTLLLPRSRRAYAEALVAATAFLARPNGSTRVRVGLGLASGLTSGLGVVPRSSTRPSKRLAQRLARRITMVMTDRTAPRVSVLGAIVVAAAVGVGAFVTPGLACPPEQQAAIQVRVKAPMKAPKRNSVPPRAQARQDPPSSSRNQPGPTFVGEAPAIEAMQEEERSAAAASPRWRGPQPPQPMDAVAGAWQGEETTRAYWLPEGKLEALIELMSRQDVPIFIDAHEDHIVVHGNERQQRDFEAFVRLIHPEGGPDQRDVRGFPMQPGAQAGPQGGPQGQRQLEQELQQLKQRQQPRTTAPRGQSNRNTQGLNPAVVEYRDAMRQMLQSRAEAERQAEAMRGDAEAARDHAEEVRDLAMALEEQARSAQDPQASAALTEARRAIAARAAALDHDAGRKATAADSLEARLAQLEAQLERAEERLAELDSMLDEDGAAADDVIEAEDTADNDAPPAASAEPSPDARPLPSVSAIARVAPPAPPAPGATTVPTVPHVPHVPTVPPVPLVKPIAPIPPAAPPSALKPAAEPR